MDVATSGMDVPTATIVTPMTHSDMPATLARLEADDTRKCPLVTTVAIPASSNRASYHCMSPDGGGVVEGSGSRQYSSIPR